MKEKPPCQTCIHGIEIIELKRNHGDYLSYGMTYCMACSRNAVAKHLRSKSELMDMYVFKENPK